jgi:hypothetical protein
MIMKWVCDSYACSAQPAAKQVTVAEQQQTPPIYRLLS